VIPTMLTVAAAGLLGGAIAANVTAIVVIAAVALVLIGIYSGGRIFADLCDLSRDEHAPR
jgi:4-hydroxybenzoate polyprenyltransferase